jgi:hypothetical protein
MRNAEAAAIANRWIAFFTTPEVERSEQQRNDDSWWEIPKEQPELCYAIILAALDAMPTDPANAAFQSLAAGPLEDLLGKHGPTVIERVETEARRNPAFNLLLGGVWKGSMTDDIWTRVQAARLNAW